MESQHLSQDSRAVANWMSSNEAWCIAPGCRRIVIQRGVGFDTQQTNQALYDLQKKGIVTRSESNPPLWRYINYQNPAQEQPNVAASFYEGTIVPYERAPTYVILDVCNVHGCMPFLLELMQRERVLVQVVAIGHSCHPGGTRSSWDDALNVIGVSKLASNSTIKTDGNPTHAHRSITAFPQTGAVLSFLQDLSGIKSVGEYWIIAETDFFVTTHVLLEPTSRDPMHVVVASNTKAARFLKSAPIRCLRNQDKLSVVTTAAELRNLLE